MYIYIYYAFMFDLSPLYLCIFAPLTFKLFHAPSLYLVAFTFGHFTLDLFTLGYLTFWCLNFACFTFDALPLDVSPSILHL